MSDLESRLRHDLNQYAADVEVVADPPGHLLARVRRRRRSRLTATAGTLALVGGLLAFLPAMTDDGGDSTDLATGPRSSRTQQLRVAPPELAGSILAHVDSQPCPGACSAARFDIRSPDTAVHIDTAGTGHVAVLADGRFVAREEGTASGWALFDPGGAPPVPLGKDVNSLDVLSDGRLVLLATNEAGQRVLRRIDPRSGSIEDRPLPSRLKMAAAVTAGPGGGVAVLGTEDGCCTPFALLVIGRDAKEELHSLSFPEVRQQTLGFPPALSWGASGLIAITGSRPQPLARAYYEGRRAPDRDELHPGWTNVVDAATGELIASLGGWQGLAWSPDGRGLLTARRDGPDASQLAVWWGPGLKQRLDVGRTNLPMVPRYWQSQ